MSVSSTEGIFNGFGNVTGTRFPGPKADGGDGGAGIEDKGFSATKLISVS